jgi:hypothetical protein
VTLAAVMMAVVVTLTPTAAAMSADDAASSMLEKGKRDKNQTEDIDIQACDTILQLGVSCRLIA